MNTSASSLKLSKVNRQTLSLRAAQNGTTIGEEVDEALIRSLGCDSKKIIRCAVADAKRELGIRSLIATDILLLAHLGFTAAQIVSIAVEDVLRKDEHMKFLSAA
jgi:hypothetical protein